MTTNSIVWSEEETRYLKALLTFNPGATDETKRKKVVEEQQQPVGEFRVLVVGAKGCGKTSILTKFANGLFVPEGQPQDPELERGCRHRVRIEHQPYTVDALEFPSRNLSSDPHLKQAIDITEGAVLVYDVKSRASFDLVARGIQELIRDTIGGSREYGLVLVGNKSDCDDEEREVSWAEAHRASAGFGVRCAFMETSAKLGDNVDRLFPELGREILKLRWMVKQRNEHVERLAAAAQEALASPTKKAPKWRSWARPWFQRRLDGRKTSVT